MLQLCSHFQNATPLHPADFDVPHFRRVQRRVRRTRAARDVRFSSPSLDDAHFTLPRLKAALQLCVLHNARGCYKLHYRGLCIDVPWWPPVVIRYITEPCALTFPGGSRPSFNFWISAARMVAYHPCGNMVSLSPWPKKGMPVIVMNIGPSHSHHVLNMLKCWTISF